MNKDTIDVVIEESFELVFQEMPFIAAESEGQFRIIVYNFNSDTATIIPHWRGSDG
jgi:hypothetical protein